MTCRAWHVKATCKEMQACSMRCILEGAAVAETTLGVHMAPIAIYCLIRKRSSIYPRSMLGSEAFPLNQILGDLAGATGGAWATRSRGRGADGPMRQDVGDLEVRGTIRGYREGIEKERL